MDLDTKADLLATPQLETPLATPSGELPPTPAAIEIAPPLVSPSLRYDAAYEAAKLPLDVAIFNSMRGAGGDDRVRKYLQAILVVGGGSHVPGMNHALESRLQAIGMQLVMNMEKVTILAPPRDVDAADLAWRGGAVLAKMEGVNDLWVTGEDWDLFGMRSVRERCFYL
jgi:actin-related protein 8